MAHLHIPLCDFYDYTPVEIDWALQAHYETKFNEIKLSWEQIRLSSYYRYLMAPSKKNKVSYNLFKKEHMPFAFDELENPAMNEETIEAIQDILKEKGM